MKQLSDVCKIDGCERPRKSLGYCRLHYDRYKRHGEGFDQDAKQRTSPGTGAQIIAEALHLPDDAPCFNWPLSKDHSGYGFTSRSGKTVQAHRLVCEIANGAPRRGQVTRHSCDNPSCINPHHLSWGSHDENIQDRQKRDRTSRGERHYKAKLTEPQVLEIYRRAQAGESRPALATAFNVSNGTVHFIANRLIWKHLFQNRP